MPPSLRLVASGSTNGPKKPSRRIRTCSLTHSANHVPLNAAATPNEATCPAHQQASTRSARVQQTRTTALTAKMLLP